MKAATVVEDFDELKHSLASSGPGWSGLAVNEFGLDGGEEAFGDGVIPALARAAERLANTVGAEERRDY